jgi:type II secretory pathway pseudopilin PulG
MRRGASLAELTVVLAIVAAVTALGLPRLGGVLDWIAVDAAAREVGTAIAVARSAAVMRGTRARAVIAADSLRLDRWDGAAWQPFERWPGPGARGVTLEVSNPVVGFDPIGLGWGAANTRVVLRRGDKTAVLTVSRVGRVKRW